MFPFQVGPSPLSSSEREFMAGIMRLLWKRKSERKKKKKLKKIFLRRMRSYQSYWVAGIGQEKTRNFWGRAYKRFQGSIIDLGKWHNRGH